jgi:hypothetical protein
VLLLLLLLLLLIASGCGIAYTRLMPRRSMHPDLDPPGSEPESRS